MKEGKMRKNLLIGGLVILVILGIFVYFANRSSADVATMPKGTTTPRNITVAREYYSMNGIKYTDQIQAEKLAYEFKLKDVVLTGNVDRKSVV